MKILATGGMGYIGSHTVVELIEKGYDVEILDNLANSKIGVLDRIEQLTGKRPVFHEADICDYARLREIFAAGNFTTVIHFAGLKAVGESVEKPLEYYETNVGGTINLLKCMREFDVRQIIFSSSATVYGDPGCDLYDESLPAGQNIPSPYGETKYMIEQILKSESVAWPEFEVTILRYFNPIGAHASGLLGEDPNGIPNNLMPIIMRVSTGQIEKLSIYGDDYPTPDGSCIRDYIHVVDLALGHIKAMEHLRPGVSIYNLGTGQGTSVFELVSTFEQVSGRPLPHEVVGRRPGDLPVVCADPAKAARELDWHATYTVSDAVRDTLNFLAHESNSAGA